MSAGLEKENGYMRNLRKLFDYFRLNENLELKLVGNCVEGVSLFEKRLNSIDAEYKESAENNDETYINLSRILQNFNLSYFDKNLKNTNCK